MITTKIVLNSGLARAIETYMKERYTGLEFDRTVASNQFKVGYDKTHGSNLITWGVKWKSSQYKRGNRNVLFLENGLLCQRKGIYVDNHGYFADSSLVTEERNKADYTPEEAEAMATLARSCFGFKIGEVNHNPDGPILIAMQMNGDAPMRYHFPAVKRFQGNRKETFLNLLVEHMPKGRPVILRPHPKEKGLPEGWKLPEGWTLEIPGAKGVGDVYKTIKRCSAVVTVNSTVATEALTSGIPVATFGYGSYKGAGVTLDCAHEHEALQGILDYTPDPEASMRYLCAVMRDHQLPYRHRNFEELLDKCTPFQNWLSDLRGIDEPVKPKRKTQRAYQKIRQRSCREARTQL